MIIFVRHIQNAFDFIISILNCFTISSISFLASSMIIIMSPNRTILNVFNILSPLSDWGTILSSPLLYCEVLSVSMKYVLFNPKICITGYTDYTQITFHCYCSVQDRIIFEYNYDLCITSYLSSSNGNIWINKFMRRKLWYCFYLIITRLNYSNTN